MFLNDTSKIKPHMNELGIQGVILPYSNSILIRSDIDLKIKKLQKHIFRCEKFNKNGCGKKYRLRKISMRQQKNIFLSKINLLVSAKEIINNLENKNGRKGFIIKNDYIKSIVVTTGLHYKGIKIKLNELHEDKRELFNRVYESVTQFGCVSYTMNEIDICTDINSLKKLIKVLCENSLINMNEYENLYYYIEKRIHLISTKKQILIKKYENFFNDFIVHIDSPYKKFDTVIRRLDLNITTLDRLHSLIQEIQRIHPDIKRLGSSLLDLFLFEGILDDLDHENIELKKCIDELSLGLTTFLQKYEKELHIIIEKDINDKVAWFQELYQDYKSMIKTGKYDPNKCYVSSANIDFFNYELHLPKRFKK